MLVKGLVRQRLYSKFSFATQNGKQPRRLTEKKSSRSMDLLSLLLGGVAKKQLVIVKIRWQQILLLFKACLSMVGKMLEWIDNCCSALLRRT